MFKKTAFIYLGLVLLGVAAVAGGLAIQNNSPADVVKEQSNVIKVVSAGEADTIIYEGIDEVEQSAQIIVEAKIVGQRSTENFVKNGEVLETYGVTNVKVNKVYKGNVKAGDILTVAEPGYFDANNKYVSFEGYKIMEENGRYLLFMTPSKSGKQVLLGLYQGKFDLNIKSEQQDLSNKSLTEEQFIQADYVGEDAEHYNKLKAEAVAKYEK